MTREVLLLVDALAPKRMSRKTLFLSHLNWRWHPLQKSVFTRTLMCACR